MVEQKDPQDDFFTEVEEPVVSKAGGYEEEVTSYEGQIADRVTDDNYEKSNLMDVGTHSHYHFSMTRSFQTKSESMFRQAMVALDVQRTLERTTDKVTIKAYNMVKERPDGGDGGHGGHVYFRSSGRLSSLYDLRRAHFFGNDGTSGMVNKESS